MFRTTYHKKLATVFMIVIVFVTMVNSFAIAKGTFVVHGKNLSGAVCQSVPPVSDETTMGDFKPPKHSFVDYGTFFSCSTFIPLNQHDVSLLSVDIGFRAVPGMWPEILIPPKI